MSPEKILMKESSHVTEHMDDTGPLPSTHNLGIQLSKYENFMSKKDIISPSKHGDQTKRIYENLDGNLLEIFDEFRELLEKKELLFENHDNWTLKYDDNLKNNSFFQVFLKKNSFTNGKFLMNFEEKKPEELFEKLVNPDKRTIWDNTLLVYDHKYGKNSKDLSIHEIYKPCSLLEKHKELQFLQYDNRIKSDYFLIGKTVKNEKKWYKEISEEKIEGFVKKLLIIVFSYTKNQKNYTGIYYEIDVLFDNSSINPIPTSLNSQLLLNYLTNFSSFLSLISPLPNFINKKPEEPLKKSLIIDKDPAFLKGNCETYPDIQNLENLYKYYHNSYHILDCILNHHNLGLIEDDNDSLIETTEKQGHFAYKKDYTRGKKGGLNFLNANLMIEQKKVILSLLRQAGSNMIHGRGLINITLPVEIFEPRSLLERLSRSFGHAPIFLEKAGKSSNILEQMKYTIAFFLSSMVLCIQQEKPFNPILGETFQGRINGCPIYLEQLNHHPPITYYYMFGKNFKLYGSHEPVANLSANACIAQQRGSPIAEFMNNGTKITFRWPLFIINGTVMGQRSFNFFSKAIAYNKEENYLCEVLFNVNEISGFKGLFQRKDYFIDEIGGGIYKVKPETIKRYELAKKPYKLELNHDTDVIETLAKIKGEWTSNVEFDGVKYWDIEKDRPFQCEYEQNCLPSDSNFRDDVMFLRMGKKEDSQVKKNEAEILQRHDKKLRENYNKNVKKNSKK